MPLVAQAVLMGGNVRVGLEDNHLARPGVPASNGLLTTARARIVERLGGRVFSAGEAREKLGLTGSSDERAAAARQTPNEGVPFEAGIRRADPGAPRLPPARRSSRPGPTTMTT